MRRRRGALVRLGEAGGELPQDVAVEHVERLPGTAVGVDHARDLRADDERRGRVRPPPHEARRLAVDPRMHVGVDDDRSPAPAQQLGLDQRVLEPQGVRLELREQRRGGPVLTRNKTGLGDHPPALDEAEDRALERRPGA